MDKLVYQRTDKTKEFKMTMIIQNKRFGLAALTGFGVMALMAGTAIAAPAATAQNAQSQLMTEASAGDANPAERGAFDFVKSVTDRGLKFLADPAAAQPAKQAEFRALLDSSFDLTTIGRFVLGRYWNTATPAQQTEFQQLFRTMIVDTYSARFSEYKGQKLDVKAYRSIGKGDTLVNSFMVPANGGTTVPIDWRVRKEGSSYKIVDVIVSGVSMSVTQRSDFASVIQRGGGNVDALLNEMRGGHQAVAPK